VKIARLDLDKLTREEQFYKVREEFEEVVEAFSEKTEEDLVEELWDLIQECFGLLFKILPTSELFRTSYNIHLRKMRTRARDGGIKILECVEVISEWIKL
jgi:hypothetical protein